MDRPVRIGDRVRVTRGFDNGSREHASYQLWCAGRVPVGSVGTVRPYVEGMHQIVWDHIESRDDGLVFGIRPADATGWLELLENPQ
jgi:hypothetical protein